MARYTAQTDFNFGTLPESRTFVADVGSGSVTIQVFDGTNYIQSDQFTADTALELFTRNTRLRIIPTGGAAFYIDEQEGLL